MIEKASNENLEEYIKSLYNIYYKDENIKKLLEQILYLKNIPIEILSKYYARLYTLNTNFQKNLNKDLLTLWLRQVQGPLHLNMEMQILRPPPLERSKG